MLISGEWGTVAMSTNADDRIRWHVRPQVRVCIKGLAHYHNSLENLQISLCL